MKLKRDLIDKSSIMWVEVETQDKSEAMGLLCLSVIILEVVEEEEKHRSWNFLAINSINPSDPNLIESISVSQDVLDQGKTGLHYLDNIVKVKM